MMEGLQIPVNITVLTVIAGQKISIALKVY